MKMRTTLSMSPTGDSPTALRRVAALASMVLLGACLIAGACLTSRMSPGPGLPGDVSTPSMALLAHIAALALALVLGGLLLLAWKSHADAHRQLRGLVESCDRERRRWTEQLVAMETQLQALRAPVARLQMRCEGTPDAATLAALASEGAEMRALIEALQACLQGLRGTAEATRWVDADRLLGQLVGDLRAAGCAVELQGRVGTTVATCPGGLRRIVKNLLDNAVGSGGAVRIRVAADEGRLAVTVTPAASGSYPLRPEPGLGLAVARRLAQAMNGDLQLRAGNDGCLEGCLTLPLALH
jgi:signal transduction histidine kinase